MKNLLFIRLTFLILIILSSVKFAQADLSANIDFIPTKTSSKEKAEVNSFSHLSASSYRISEAGYLAGLQSGNPGIEISSAYFLGEMKSAKALFPLTKMFREAKSDQVKLLAAWSLLKIGDSRGVYLVKRESEIGDCENIRCMLQFLYMDYSLKTNGRIDTN